MPKLTSGPRWCLTCGALAAHGAVVMSPKADNFAGLTAVTLAVLFALAIAAPAASAAAPAAPGAPAQPAPAGGDDARAAVNAATSNAIERLREDVGAARITRDLTVEQFVRQTDSEAELKQVLRRAQQIGGPRWSDDEGLCQVQVEIAGDRVADALVRVAENKPDRSPIRPEELARELKAWRARSFSATGKSSSYLRVQRIVPYPQHRWEGVNDELRERALRAAQEDAGRRALDSVRNVPLAPGLTVGDALTRPEVAQRMNQWFERRPIKTVSFNENLQVDLTLGAPADETFDELLGALGAQAPQDAQALERARAEFVSRMAEPVGRASVARESVQSRPAEVEVPQQAPEWVNRQLDAEGVAPAPPQPKGARALARVNAAQDEAIHNLRAQIGALPLSEGLTVDEAGRKDPRIARALDRAMLRARLFKVDYGADGGVTVRMTIDAQDVWDEISGAR